MSDDRELAALIVEGTAGVAETIGAGLAGTPAGAALAGGAAIAQLVARLVRTVGVQSTDAMLRDLLSRRNEGAISDEDLYADNARVVEAIASWYAGEHPDDDPDAEVE